MEWEVWIMNFLTPWRTHSKDLCLRIYVVLKLGVKSRNFHLFWSGGSKKNENFEILLPSSELHRILTRSHLKMFGTALQSTLRSIRLIPLDKLSKSLNWLSDLRHNVLGWKNGPWSCTKSPDQKSLNKLNDLLNWLSDLKSVDPTLSNAVSDVSLGARNQVLWQD